MSNGPVWQELVAIAVPGTARREPAASAWADELGVDVSTFAAEAPQQVLAAAALATAGRRAGVTPESIGLQPDREIVDPAPPESLTVAPTLARWFDLLVGERSLLPVLLTGMVERGLVFPARIVPDVLDHGIRDPGARLTELALATTGRRGAWLAAQDERWRRYAALATGLGAEAEAPSRPPTLSGNPPSEVDGLDDRAWREGDPATRIAWLQGLAISHPATAMQVTREALTGRGESADLRERIVALLAGSPAPEAVELLEAALDDRAAGVRRAAARALAGRPDPSPFQQRMAERALAWVRRSSAPRKLFGGGGALLVVDPPDGLGDAERRDQLDTEWHAHGTVRGDAARHVHAAVAAAPLSTWAALGTPEQLVLMPVSEGWAQLLHQSWVRRTLVEGDARWADALVSTGATTPGLAGLLAWCSPLVREEVVLRRLAIVAGQPELAVEALDHLPHPWSPRVWRAFLDAIPAMTVGPPHRWAGTFARTALDEPPERAADLTVRLPGLPPAWAALLQRCIETLHLRAELRQALDEAARGIPDPPETTAPPPPEGDSP
jgi:hypothetical protein